MATPLPDPVAALLAKGTVIPAHPLALTAQRRLDERYQRALSRYYAAAGAGGVAVGVHTTQFAIRDPAVGLLEPVLALAAEEAAAVSDRPYLLVAGACGDTTQAVSEATLARDLGYHAALLSPVVPGASEADLLDRTRAVGEVLPVIGFYLQQAIGGPVLSLDFWRRFCELDAVVAIKVAPFHRYRTLDVIRAVCESDRGADIALYTGNDDAIIADLLTDLTVDGVTRSIVGGLLGQFAVWTRGAVALHEQVRRARAGDDAVLRELLRRAPQLTDANAAVFDAANGFAGVIAGTHAVLRGQGLLKGLWCLDPAETVSPGQLDELDRVRAAYPWLIDDDFVAEHLDEWLR